MRPSTPELVGPAPQDSHLGVTGRIWGAGLGVGGGNFSSRPLAQAGGFAGAGAACGFLGPPCSPDDSFILLILAPPRRPQLAPAPPWGPPFSLGDAQLTPIYPGVQHQHPTLLWVREGIFPCMLLKNNNNNNNKGGCVHRGALRW